MGVYGITPNLRRLAREGIWFTNFYANSFRTDRALVSIHSGLPAQPTMSVMDIPHKSTSLPSIAGQLAKNGYKTVFYYGGDINYSNMRSYFMGTGFQQVVSESDFPSKKRISKWGVADGDVFDRMLTDIKLDKSGKPFFRSIMTESSHEPFDVPDYNKIRNNPVLNSFSYADYCLGKFVEELKKLPLWDNTIVAIVPDHLGAYPDIADNYVLWRYQTPFIIIGGSVDKMECNVFGSQIDIAATLLGMLGIDHSEFVYSKDLLDESAPHFAYFTFPDAMGMVTDSNCIVYDNTSARIQYSSGKGTQMLLRKSQAYLQKLYDDLEKR
jgi:phosphoglycerol transferase MdoB-like AlkP superfamily enzyme